MDVFHYPGLALPSDRYAATIGFFDGVHLGHQYLLRQLKREATDHDLKSMAVTFDRHPREVVQTGWRAPLLSSPEEKVQLLSQTGIDVLVVLRFDETMAALTARQFMGDVLRDRLHADVLLTGYDNRFGHDRKATFLDYQRYGRELGMEVVCADPLTVPSPPVGTGLNSTPLTGGGPEVGTPSSSLIRRLLANGDVAHAATCLGRYYSISGHVVHGDHNGHALGFPTANLLCDDGQKLIPATGGYAVMTTLADGTRHRAMTYIGTRPTFHGQDVTIETNIFDETGDFYGQPLKIDFVARLRDEQPFLSQEALAAQLAHDRETATHLLQDLP